MNDNLLNFVRCPDCGGNLREASHNCQANLNRGNPAPDTPHYDSLESCEICGVMVYGSNLLRHEEWHENLFDWLFEPR